MAQRSQIVGTLLVGFTVLFICAFSGFTYSSLNKANLAGHAFKELNPLLQMGSAHVGGPDGTRCKRLPWFMGVRSSSNDQDYEVYLKTALLSARQYAPSLIPYLVYSGAPNELTAWFEKLGGQVLFHELSFAEQLRKATDTGKPELAWEYDSRGTYLRLDIPDIMPSVVEQYKNDPTVETDYFLYTDADVLFLQDISTCSFPEKPPFVAISSEILREATPFNAGVMFVNVTALAQEKKAIIAYGEAKGWELQGRDQTLLQEFTALHGLTMTFLPEVFNWKPYWGTPPTHEEDAAIVHFHGPKPLRWLPCLLTNHPKDYSAKCEGCPPIYIDLVNAAPDRGQYYLRTVQLFHTLLLSENDWKLGVKKGEG